MRRTAVVAAALLGALAAGCSGTRSGRALPRAGRTPRVTAVTRVLG